MEKIKAAFNPNKDVTIGKKDDNNEDLQDGLHHESQIESGLDGGNTNADITDKDVTAEGPKGEGATESLSNQKQEAAANVKAGQGT